MRKNSSKSTLAKNRKARFDYEISDTYVAGIELWGFEVKSAKQGQISLKESFVRVERGEVWLNNAHIAKWQHATVKEYDPQRRRKLLLGKKEIKELFAAQEGKGMTIVPLEVFTKGSWIKVRIGIGKGRKRFDKRAKIKEREMKKQIKQDLAKVRRY